MPTHHSDPRTDSSGASLEPSVAAQSASVWWPEIIILRRRRLVPVLLLLQPKIVIAPLRAVSRSTDGLGSRFPR